MAKRSHMVRLRTDIWATALIRRVQSEGAFATVSRRGAREAGAIYLVVNRMDGAFDCYGPAPQTYLAESPESDRLFLPIRRGVAESDVLELLASEERFDPDLWVIEIEDRLARPFADVVDSEGA